MREDETVMRLLQSHFDVETRFGGKFVEAIDGVEGSGGAGTRDWFYYVNGIWADRGAADWEVEPGDVIQWDNRDWSVTGAHPGDRRRVPGAVPERHRGRAAAGAARVRRRGRRGRAPTSRTR